jgi:hypothetical protein
LVAVVAGLRTLALERCNKRFWAQAGLRALMLTPLEINDEARVAAQAQSNTILAKFPTIRQFPPGG